MQANLYALGAIALWASLASLGVSLTHIPPFLLTGIALITGSVPAWPFVLRDPSQWRIPLRTLALGVYGLFAYHFLLFIALRHAPPVEANLVNYLWPLFIVVLSPVVLPGVALRLPHVLAALLGFGGAAIAIAGGRELSGTLAWGYLPALAAAFIWATYSLLTKRVRIQGFIVFDDYGDRQPEFISHMVPWVRDGKVKFREDVVDGLEQAPEAFIGLLEGRNFGKLVVKVAQD